MLSRRQRVALLSACTAVTVSAGVAVVTVASAAAIRQEVETAPATCDGAIESNHAGYSGSGFCNGSNAVGAAAQFTVNASAAGTATIAVRYANGATDNRPADVLVNGSVVQAASTFDPTGAWTTWATKTLTASLNRRQQHDPVEPDHRRGPGQHRLRRRRDDRHPAAVRDGPADGGPEPGRDQRPLRVGQPGVLAAARHRAGRHRLQRLPRRHQAERVADHHLHQLPRRRAPRRRLVHGAAVVDGVEQAASAASLQLRQRDTWTCRSPPAGPRRSYYRQRRQRRRPRRRRAVRDRPEVGPVERRRTTPSRAYTGNVYVDAYRLNGTRLWRIDLGRNIRAGAHYTQFQVYDYDGDGRAEVAMKTADGTASRHRAGHRRRACADYRNAAGYILTGPEYLTMFNGLTGAAHVHGATTSRPAAPSRRWGDSLRQPGRPVPGRHRLPGRAAAQPDHGARLLHPRGDRRVGLPQRHADPRWTFDSSSAPAAQLDRPGQPPAVHRRRRRRRHATRSSTARWRSTTTAPACGPPAYGHGDALHVGDLDPVRPGLEVFKVRRGHAPARRLDGATPAPARSSGRTPTAAAATTAAASSDDIYAGSPGAESGRPARPDQPAQRQRRQRRAQARARPTSSPGGTATRCGNCSTAPTSTSTARAATPACSPPPACTPTTAPSRRRRSPATSSATGAKRSSGPRRQHRAAHLRHPDADRPRIYTLLHDPQYRVAIAWQNTAYNQPPHPSFFIGDGMTTPPRPDIYLR